MCSRWGVASKVWSDFYTSRTRPKEAALNSQLLYTLRTHPTEKQTSAFLTQLEEEADDTSLCAPFLRTGIISLLAGTQSGLAAIPTWKATRLGKILVCQVQTWKTLRFSQGDEKAARLHSQPALCFFFFFRLLFCVWAGVSILCCQSDVQQWLLPVMSLWSQPHGSYWLFQFGVRLFHTSRIRSCGT